MAELSMVFDLLARDRASSEVENVGESFEEAGDRADGFGERVSGVFAGIAAAAAGAGLAAGAAFTGALEAESANNLLTAQLGLPPDMAAELGAVAGNLYAANYGESVAETSDAIRATLSAGLLPEDATNEQIESLTGRLFSLADVMQVDVGGAANAAGQLVRTGLAASADEAADLLARATQQGGNQFGDLADTISSSAGTLAQYGLSGAEALGLITQTLDNGAPSADFFVGALEEISGNAADSADVFETLGLNGAAMTEALTNGGPAARDALFSVIEGLQQMQDPAARTQALVALFGEEAAALQGALLGLDPSTAVAGLGNVAGAAAAADASLAQGIGPTLANLGRTAEVTASTGMSALLAGFTQGKTDGDGWQATVQNLGASLSGTLGPALSAVGGFATDVVGPALGTVFGFLADNQTTVTVVAALIGTVLAGAFAVWGTRALIAAGQNVAAWFSAVAASTTGAGASSLSALQVVASWVLMGAQATWNALKMAGAWVLGVITGGATAVASMVVAAASVVGGWVVMGVQSLLNAARMAAAWLIAMGPVGWIIAAVVGLVALIIANWETVSRFTSDLWNRIVGWITGAWNNITSGVSSGISSVIGFVTGLPGRILSALGNFGSLLLDAGADLLSGLWDGISGSIDWLLDKVGDFFGSILPGWVMDMLGIASPSKVFAEFGRWTMRGFAAGIDDGASGALDAAERAMSAVTGVGSGMSVDVGGSLGYTSGSYEFDGIGGATAAAASNRTVHVSGVVGPEEVAALVRREQATDEFLAGAGL